MSKRELQSGTETDAESAEDVTTKIVDIAERFGLLDDGVDVREFKSKVLQVVRENMSDGRTVDLMESLKTGEPVVIEGPVVISDARSITRSTRALIVTLVSIAAVGIGTASLFLLKKDDAGIGKGPLKPAAKAPEAPEPPTGNGLSEEDMALIGELEEPDEIWEESVWMDITSDVEGGDVYRIASARDVGNRPMLIVYKISGEQQDQCFTLRAHTSSEKKDGAIFFRPNPNGDFTRTFTGDGSDDAYKNAPMHSFLTDVPSEKEEIDVLEHSITSEANRDEILAYMGIKGTDVTAKELKKKLLQQLNGIKRKAAGANQGI